MATTATDLQRWRSLFPITSRGAYLYNGGVGPSVAPVRDAVIRALDIWNDQGGLALWVEGERVFHELRQRLATLMHVSSDDIVILDSTTSAINLAISLLGLRATQNIVVSDLEFMAGTYAVLGRLPRPELRVAKSEGGELSVAAVAAQITPDTGAINLAHVTVASGYRHDLEALADLARDRGVPLIVDVAQSLGVVPVDASADGVAFAAGTASKWLLGGPGVGFLYVRKDFQDRPPPAPGWFGTSNSAEWAVLDPRFETSAKRFQAGIPNVLGLYAANAGIQLLQEVGISTVSDRVLDLSGYLIDRLTEAGIDVWTPRPRAKRAGLVFLRGIDEREFMHAAAEHNLTVGNFLGGIRVDPHFYNTEDELDLVVELAAQFRQAPNEPAR